MYAAAGPDRAVPSLPQLTIWGLYPTHQGKLVTWPAGDTGTATHHLTWPPGHTAHRMNTTHPAPRPGRSRNTRTRLSRPRKPALAGVQREFPGYHWRAASGLFCARPCEARPGDPAPVKGDDPPDLPQASLPASGCAGNSPRPGYGPA
jgi:hypothetical protein